MRDESKAQCGHAATCCTLLTTSISERSADIVFSKRMQRESASNVEMFIHLAYRTHMLNHQKIGRNLLLSFYRLQIGGK
jgi:hypothetical protein